MRFDFASGTFWGCGLYVNGPGSKDGKIVSADVDGCPEALLELRASRPLRLSLRMSEMGAAEAERVYPVSSDDCDGEQYQAEFKVGAGTWQRVRVPLADLEPNVWWGNQRGRLGVDLRHVREVDLCIDGNQGEGTLEIRSIRFSAAAAPPQGAPGP